MLTTILVSAVAVVRSEVARKPPIGALATKLPGVAEGLAIEARALQRTIAVHAVARTRWSIAVVPIATATVVVVRSGAMGRERGGWRRFEIERGWWEGSQGTKSKGRWMARA